MIQDRSPHDLFADRLDGRCAVRAREHAADCVHGRQKGRARRESEEDGLIGVAREISQNIGNVMSAVMNQRVHGNHIVEAAEIELAHIAAFEADRAWQVVLLRIFCRDANKLG